MNILVFIKQVADTEARISMNSDGTSLEIENKYAVNFFDEFSVEEAIRIKERTKDSEITVATYGSRKATEALRTTMAMGADKAVLIDNSRYAKDDPLVIAKILAAFARQGEYDLILCGRQAIDDENAMIGPMVAELLGLPFAGSIQKLDVIDGGSVQVETEVEGGREALRITLPALLTTQKDLNTPRVPLITGVMKAMKTQIPEVDPASLGIPENEIGEGAQRVTVLGYENKKERPAVKIIEGATPEEKVKKLVAALKDEAKVL